MIFSGGLEGNTQFSGQIPYSVSLDYPAYQYGPPHTFTIALNVRTYFILKFVTVTLGADGNPVSVVHSPIDAHLVSGPIRNSRVSGSALKPTDVDTMLLGSQSMTAAPGAHPFGVTVLTSNSNSVARWIRLSFKDPDTGEAITTAYDASNGFPASRTVFDSTAQREYIISSISVADPFRLSSPLDSMYFFGRRSYTHFVTAGLPDYTSPYTAVPDTAQLIQNFAVTINLTRTIHYAPLISPPSLQKSGFTPSLTASIGLPAGGGSPRLALASSRTYCDVHVASTYDSSTEVMTKTVSRKYTVTAVRCSVSSDLGATFESAVDIAVQFLDGTDLTDGLSGTDTATETFSYNGTTFTTGTTSDPDPWAYSFARAISMLVAAHGGLFIDGAAQPPILPFGASAATVYRTRQWKGPRLTADSSARSGWRDGATVNADPASGSVQLNGSGTFWWTRGGYDGVRGAGGNSWGPSLMVHANKLTIPPTTAISADGGDTWSTSTTAASAIPAVSSLAHQRGASFDGAHVSLHDYLGGSSTLVTGLPSGPAYLLAGADGTTVRVASVATTGAVTIYTCRTPLSSPVWVTRPGPVPMTQSTLPIVGFTWQQRCVIALCPAPDLIAVYASDDDCMSWQPTCWSSDNMVSWRPGGYDA